MEILFSFPGGLFLSVMVPLNFIHFDHLLTSTSFFGVQNSRYSEYERSGSTEISCCSMISVGKHYGLRQVVKDVAVDKPLVHILQWFRMARYSMEMICLWFQNVEHLWLVRPVGVHGHQHQISKVSSVYQSSSFAWTELPSNSPRSLSLFLQLWPLNQVQMLCTLQSVTNSKEFDTADHTRPRKVPSSDWLDSCYSKKTSPWINICPNFCHNEWNMLWAYLQEFGLPFLSAHQFADGKQSFRSIWFREPPEVVSKI